MLDNGSPFLAETPSIDPKREVGKNDKFGCWDKKIPSCCSWNVYQAVLECVVYGDKKDLCAKPASWHCCRYVNLANAGIDCDKNGYLINQDGTRTDLSQLNLKVPEPADVCKPKF